MGHCRGRLQAATQAGWLAEAHAPLGHQRLLQSDQPERHCAERRHPPLPVGLAERLGKAEQPQGRPSELRR